MPGETVSVEREIKAGAEELWARVADVTRMSEWSPENVGAVWLAGPEPGTVDSRFEGTNRNGGKTWKTVGTVVLSQPGRAFAFNIHVGPLAIARWSYTFEPTERTTRVIETWEDRRNILVRLVTPLVTGVRDRGPHNRAGMEQTLDALKAHVEKAGRHQ